MNEFVLQALIARVKAGMMQPEQVPEPYRQAVLDGIPSE